MARAETKVSVVRLGNGGFMPTVALGTAVFPFGTPETKQGVLDAIEVGYRHIDTAALYQSEIPIGEAIAEALARGLVASRDELFVTSKLWCCDARPDLVLPALKHTLQNLGLDRIDLYLIHFPLCCTPGRYDFPIAAVDLLPFDLPLVWAAMEECVRLGLAGNIGVSNFSCSKLDELLRAAKIPPAVNQVEMNPMWQQKELRKYCSEKGIQVSAYYPLGGQDYPGDVNKLKQSEELIAVAQARGKSKAQICLRWLFEQGVAIVVKSYNRNRMTENLRIFDWKLTAEDYEIINKIPQHKRITADGVVTGEPPPELRERLVSDLM